jgi:hypothetical protein
MAIAAWPKIYLRALAGVSKKEAKVQSKCLTSS